MARFEFRLPDIGEGIAEAEIVAWHVAVGDAVREDQALADMMTDKATVEMESPVSGVVVEVAGEVGDQVAIGATLVVIDTGDAAIADRRPSTVDDADALAPRQDDRDAADAAAHPSVGSEHDVADNEPPVVSPIPDVEEDARRKRARLRTADDDATVPVRLASSAVRVRARELGIDLARVQHEGRHVRHADLDAFLTYRSAEGYHAPHASRSRPDETVKVIGMRRRIAENMVASKRAIPHFTYVEEIDVTALEDMRGNLNASRGERPKLTLLPFLIVAICRAIPDFPMMNARYDDVEGVVTRHGRVHLGMATQTNAGLMVPVIRDAQDRNLWQLATEVERLANAARSGRATSEELSGSTLTVTSLGPLGGIATTPVINRPEVAIIGPNRIVERPVLRADALGKDRVVRAKLMNLSISCDHRVVDGWDAASYVQALRKLLETPVLLFVEP